ncbi:MAG: hypothetical protein HKL80_09900 [Acidimicrobiales bacterium]|nr:hypothetical protein [Acidimicrobiales bacterium]
MNTGTSTPQVVFATESNGIWTSYVIPNSVYGPGFVVSSITFDSLFCASASQCITTGTINGYLPESTFSMPEGNTLMLSNIGGTWKSGFPTPPLGNVITTSSSGNYASTFNLSCYNIDNCVGIESYIGPLSSVPFVLDSEANGVWQRAVAPNPGNVTVPGGATFPQVASCPSATLCFVAGMYIDPLAPQAPSGSGMCPRPCQVVIDQFNGTSWSSDAVGFRSSYISGNASIEDSTCPTSTYCLLSGYFESQITSTEVAERSFFLSVTPSGITQTLAATPSSMSANANELVQQISCSNIAFCVGLGQIVNGTSRTSLLVEFNDGKWLAYNYEPLVGTDTTSDVSCAPSLLNPFCQVVGLSSVNGSNDLSLEGMDVSETTTAAFTIAMPSQTPTGSYPNLNSASNSCVSYLNCLIFVNGFTGTLGAVDTATIVNELNGVRSLQPVPIPPGYELTINVLITDISCPSAGNCTAVGSYLDSDGLNVGLVETESNGTWTGTEIPPITIAFGQNDPNKINPNPPLYSISCSSGSDCLAVSNDGNTGPILCTEVNGVWQSQIPQTPSALDPQNQGISYSHPTCLSGLTCYIVAQIATEYVGVAYLITDTTGNLSVQLVPISPDLTLNQIGSKIYCQGVNDCEVMLVVDGQNSGYLLLEDYENSTWNKSVMLENVNSDSMSCSKLNNCIMSTYGGNFVTSNPTMYVQSGSSLSKVNLNPTNLTEAVLKSSSFQMFSMDCSVGGSCILVGTYVSNNDLVLSVVIEEVNSTWVILSPPQPANAVPTKAIMGYGSFPQIINSGNGLTSVSCTDSGTCYAVGTYTDSAGNIQEELVTIKGTSMYATQVSLPGSVADRAPGSYIGSSISCSTATDCVIVGTYEEINGGTVGFISPANRTAVALSVTGSSVVNQTSSRSSSIIGSNSIVSAGSTAPATTSGGSNSNSQNPGGVKKTALPNTVNGSATSAGNDLGIILVAVAIGLGGLGVLFVILILSKRRSLK